MAVKTLFRTAALAAALLAAAACVYPYEVELSQSGEWPLVVEGNILLGSTTTVSLSHVHPLDADEFEFQSISATGYIEGEDGSRVEGLSYSSFITFDTRTLRDDQRYRLCFTTQMNGQESNSFESDWLAPCPAPTIDALTYSHHPEYEELWIGLSMHCNGSHYFRWYFDETWEYHSDLWASHYLYPELMFNDSTGEYQPWMALFEFSNGQNTYYCWNTFHSPQIKIFSTSEQTDNRFTDLEFHRVRSDNRKLQILYKLTVHLEAISENAYRYWQNIENNTNNQGTIFSPVPSQMTGNIHCISDPSSEVIGYISAAQAVEAEMYYDNHQEQFYNGPDTDWRSIVIEEFNDPYYFAHWYSRGYLPYTVIPPEMGDGGGPLYQWTKAECVDCTRLGGTKEKPEGWPNDHR